MWCYKITISQKIKKLLCYKNTIILLIFECYENTGSNCVTQTQLTLRAKTNIEKEPSLFDTNVGFILINQWNLS